jgi:RNA polymerase sigma-70 factor, ECF subfamily
LEKDMPDGPGESFQAVFQRSFSDIYGYVAYRLAPDWDAAQEVTQESFVAAWQAWNSYRGDGMVLSWIRGIARRKVADHLRAKARARGFAGADAIPRLAAREEDSRDEQLLRLAEVMRQLPVEYVELLEEKYIEGLSVQQMAAKRGRTGKAIESALSRARDRFRRTFHRLQTQEEVRE